MTFNVMLPTFRSKTIYGRIIALDHFETLTYSRLADRWAQGRDFYNCCGPTEVTIVNTMQKHQPGELLTIGRPVPNTTVYVLDEHEEHVPIGVRGVMWVGGSCVSRGYIDLPELTNARYKEDKFRKDG